MRCFTTELCLLCWCLLQVTEFLNEAEVIVVPFANPDGYEVRGIGEEQRKRERERGEVGKER